VIGDPFGGIGGGGIIAAYHGLRWVGVELEPNFVELAVDNFRLHKSRWEATGDPMPEIVQGDSREFARLVGEVAGVLTSPPYSEGTVHGGGHSIDWEKAQCDKAGRKTSPAREGLGEGYGTTPGQIGQLKSGDLDGVISSPPYAEGLGHGGQPKPLGNAERYPKVMDAMQEGYGDTPGQIGNMPGGSLDGAVTSPPWEQSGTIDHVRQTDSLRFGKFKGGGTRFLDNYDYGQATGQIGNESKDDYWTAMKHAYRQMYLAMRPNAVAAIVVKDFVRAGQRVPLCDQTAQLLEHCGFKVFERTRCWLVKEDRHPGLFGEDIVKVKERKSFFRRLAEKKGSPRIDYEEVIWCRSEAE
jgi:hypothetical protein